MIADILMYISIICVFASLIPACISDFKTRLVDPKIWRPAAFIGGPCAIIAFSLKLIYSEIIVPSLILLLASVLIVIGITVIFANIRDPFYKPEFCELCDSPITTKSEIIKCSRCDHNSGKAILGGADMIAIDIIMITSFYISTSFILTFILSFAIASSIIIAYLIIKSKNIINYRIPLIIPITIGYIMTLALIFLNINILKYMSL